jgi:hypothetical protein
VWLFLREETLGAGNMFQRRSDIGCQDRCKIEKLLSRRTDSLVSVADPGIHGLLAQHTKSDVCSQPVCILSTVLTLRRRSASPPNEIL